MIDTHCHLTYPGLAERRDAVIADAAAAGVDRLVTIGTGVDDSAAACAVAAAHAGVYATVGIHPLHADAVTEVEADAAALRVLAGRDRVVGLGEMGLDFHYGDIPESVQRPVFEAQLGLAAELPHLPVVIHNRKATEATLEILRASGLAPERFVFHCFTGSEAEVDDILGFGAWVGITGIATFKSAADVAAASDRVPLDRLLIETDAPYLTPAPHRKVRTNEPKYLVHTAAFLAERRGLSLRDFEAATTANAERFYQLLPSR